MIHFSECKLFNDNISSLEEFYSKPYSKKIGFCKINNQQMILVTYEKKNESCFKKNKFNLLIEIPKLKQFLEDKFYQLKDEIDKNKNKVIEFQNKKSLS